VIRKKHAVINNMMNNQDIKYQSYIKRAWAIYALITIALIAILVLFVAQDNEERFFFTIMPAAAAYVFRPTHRYLGKLIFKFTGVSQPSENE
jgi:Kef-type K+ transport system membrane component KefB